MVRQLLPQDYEYGEHLFRRFRVCINTTQRTLASLVVVALLDGCAPCVGHSDWELALYRPMRTT